MAAHLRTKQVSLFSIIFILKNKVQGKSTYMFSAKHLPLSAPPTCWLYAKRIMGEGGRKVESGKSGVRRKMYTLIYLDPKIMDKAAAQW